MGAREDYIELFKYMNSRRRYKKDINNILNNLKNYIIENPYDNISISIKTWLFNSIKTEFLNKNLDSAFNMSDSLPYTKIVEIYNNLPFINTFPDFKFYFYNLLNINKNELETPKSFYQNCKNYYYDYEGEAPDIFDKVLDYCDKNISIMDGSPIAYSTKVLRRLVCKPDNNSLGNIGEHFVYDSLSTIGKTILLPNNGFGYDILHNSEDKELLVEVKSINKNIEKDTNFKITGHERKIIKHTLNLPNTEYVIARVFTDRINNTYSYVILHYDYENDCFYSIDNPRYNIKYVSHSYNSLKYEADITKKKALILKK